MRKGEIATGSLSAISFIAAFDAYAGTGTSSWLADLCLSGDTPAPMIEGIPMEDHTGHAAYFASAGLTFLAAALGWESAEAQITKLLNSEPTGLQRKRLLAAIVYVAASANRATNEVAEQAFEKITGYSLGAFEAEKAFSFLLRNDAPDLQRILAGATDRERQHLLQAVVFTWSAIGMDSEQATQVTERIVALLGFNEDDMCKTLDRIWLKANANKGLLASLRLTHKALIMAWRAIRHAARAAMIFLAPHAKQLTTRALATIQR